MIITLAELNRALAALPDPRNAREAGRMHWRVAIETDMPVQPLYEDPGSIGPTIRFATFELKKVAKSGGIFWRWTPCDELIID